MRGIMMWMAGIGEHGLSAMTLAVGTHESPLLET